jgi:hypothetical protein
MVPSILLTALRLNYKLCRLPSTFWKTETIISSRVQLHASLIRGKDLSVIVKIVTDSSAYPEPKVTAKHDIRVVPLKVAFGSEVFAEGGGHYQ